jgi:hypothetical protein
LIAVQIPPTLRGGTNIYKICGATRNDSPSTNDHHFDRIRIPHHERSSVGGAREVALHAVYKEAHTIAGFFFEGLPEYIPCDLRPSRREVCLERGLFLRKPDDLPLWD